MTDFQFVMLAIAVWSFGVVWDIRYNRMERKLNAALEGLEAIQDRLRNR